MVLFSKLTFIFFFLICSSFTKYLLDTEYASLHLEEIMV